MMREHKPVSDEGQMKKKGMFPVGRRQLMGHVRHFLNDQKSFLAEELLVSLDSPKA